MEKSIKIWRRLTALAVSAALVVGSAAGITAASANPTIAAAGDSSLYAAEGYEFVVYDDEKLGSITDRDYDVYAVESLLEAPGKITLSATDLKGYDSVKIGGQEITSGGVEVDFTSGSPITMTLTKNNSTENKTLHVYTISAGIIAKDTANADVTIKGSDDDGDYDIAHFDKSYVVDLGDTISVTVEPEPGYQLNGNAPVRVVGTNSSDSAGGSWTGNTYTFDADQPVLYVIDPEEALESAELRLVASGDTGLYGGEGYEFVVYGPDKLQDAGITDRDYDVYAVKNLLNADGTVTLALEGLPGGVTAAIGSQTIDETGTDVNFQPGTPLQLTFTKGNGNTSTRTIHVYTISAGLIARSPGVANSLTVTNIDGTNGSRATVPQDKSIVVDYGDTMEVTFTYDADSYEVDRDAVPVSIIGGGALDLAWSDDSTFTFEVDEYSLYIVEIDEVLAEMDNGGGDNGGDDNGGDDNGGDDNGDDNGGDDNGDDNGGGDNGGGDNGGGDNGGDNGGGDNGGDDNGGDNNGGDDNGGDNGGDDNGGDNGGDDNGGDNGGDSSTDVGTASTGGSGGSGGGSRGGGRSRGGSSSSRSTPDSDRTSNSTGAGTNTTSTGGSNVSAGGGVSPSITAQVASMAQSEGATVTVNTRNASTISPSVLQAMLQAAGNKDVVLHADTTTANGRAVQGRLYVEPAKLTGLSGNLSLGVYTESAKTSAVQTYFETHFENQVEIVHLEHQGSFGASLQVAANVNLSGLELSGLHLYSFDRNTNTYTEIPRTGAYVDTNGFFHFYTATGGDVIIADGPLSAK